MSAATHVDPRWRTPPQPPELGKSEFRTFLTLYRLPGLDEVQRDLLRKMLLAAARTIRAFYEQGDATALRIYYQDLWPRLDTSAGRDLDEVFEDLDDRIANQ